MMHCFQDMVKNLQFLIVTSTLFLKIDLSLLLFLRSGLNEKVRKMIENIAENNEMSISHCLLSYITVHWFTQHNYVTLSSTLCYTNFIMRSAHIHLSGVLLLGA